jgi:hypothetical protein
MTTTCSTRGANTSAVSGVSPGLGMKEQLFSHILLWLQTLKLRYHGIAWKNVAWLSTAVYKNHGEARLWRARLSEARLQSP